MNETAALPVLVSIGFRGRYRSTNNSNNSNTVNKNNMNSHTNINGTKFWLELSFWLIHSRQGSNLVRFMSQRVKVKRMPESKTTLKLQYMRL